MRQEVRVLIIGLGNIAMDYDYSRDDVTWTHIGAINAHNNFKLVAAIDPDISRHKKLSNISDASSYLNIDDFLLANRQQIDLVVIASPTEYHLANYIKIKSLQPKLVLMEKPLISNKQNLQDLILEVNSGPPVMVNLFRLFQEQVNSSLAKLSASGRCQIQVRYSKNVSHNGIHFMSLIIRHFGNIKSQHDFILQGIKSLQYDFEMADVVMQPAMSNLDDNSMVVHSSQGTLYYLNGGRVAFFIDENHMQHHYDDFEFQHHMANVYQHCFKVINGSDDDSLSLAYRGHEILKESAEYVT